MVGTEVPVDAHIIWDGCLDLDPGVVDCHPNKPCIPTRVHPNNRASQRGCIPTTVHPSEGVSQQRCIPTRVHPIDGVEGAMGINMGLDRVSVIEGSLPGALRIIVDTQAS